MSNQSSLKRPEQPHQVCGKISLLTAASTVPNLIFSIPRTVRICTPLFSHNFDFH